MTFVTSMPSPGLPLILGFAGLIFGLVYFAALRRTVALFAEGRSRFSPLALTLGRVVAALIFLGVAAHLGAASLLAAFIGFLLARTIALRAERRTT